MSLLKELQKGTVPSNDVICHNDAPVSSWNQYFRILYPGIDRPPLLTEYLPELPYMVLQEVFSKYGRCEALKDHLLQWLSETAFDETGDDENIDRKALKQFYNELLLLIEALDTINNIGIQAKSAIPFENDLWQFVRNFCERYTQVYIKRELWCLLHAAIDQALNAPDELMPGDALEWYEEVSALVESAYLICEVECV